MSLIWSLAAAGVLVSALVVAAVPARWLFRSIVLWLVIPIPAYFAFVVWDSLCGAHTPHFLSNALLGFSLLSAFLLIPWLIVCGTGFFMGFLLRGVFRHPGPKDPVAARQVDYGREPHPREAWRAALVILIGSIGAIAGAAYLSSR